MTAHTCKTLTDGCYRCDLHRDEINSYVESLVVTRKGVVHEPDCSFVSGITSTATPRGSALSGDRPCSRCLPYGIPEVV